MKKTIFALGLLAFVAIFFVLGCDNADDQPTLSLTAQSGTIAWYLKWLLFFASIRSG